MNDRERLIELLKAKYDHYCDQCGVNKQTDYIENLVDYLIVNGVTVQKHGRWEIILDEWDCEFAKCSACGGEFYDLEDTIDTLMNYCPNCGAKMGEEIDHD